MNSLTNSLPVFATGSTGDLIARAKRGDEAAFRELFETHKRRVYSICLRMTHNSTDAEDLTQDAFLLVFRKISTFRGESSFSTWLYRLTVNVVLMHLRRKCVPQVSFDDANSLGEPAAHDYGDNDRQLMGTIDRLHLKKALANLPAGYRTAFVLFDQEGYEHHEIARMMNWSVGNSKSQLHKARRKLREWFRVHSGKGSHLKGNQAGKTPGMRSKTVMRNRLRPHGMGDLGIEAHSK